MLKSSDLKAYFKKIAQKHTDIQDGENGKVRFVQFDQRDEVSTFVKKCEFSHFFMAFMKPTATVRKNQSGTHRKYFSMGFYLLRQCKVQDVQNIEDTQDTAEEICEDIRQKILKDCYDGLGTCIKINNEIVYPDWTEWSIDPIQAQAENSAGIWCEFKMYINISPCNYNQTKWLP
jgi:hypothetical protein